MLAFTPSIFHAEHKNNKKGSKCASKISSNKLSTQHTRKYSTTVSLYQATILEFTNTSTPAQKQTVFFDSHRFLCAFTTPCQHTCRHLSPQEPSALRRGWTTLTRSFFFFTSADLHYFSHATFFYAAISVRSCLEQTI